MPDNDVLAWAKAERDKWHRLRRTQMASYSSEALDDLIALAETQARQLDEIRQACNDGVSQDQWLSAWFRRILAILDGNQQ